MVDKNSGRSLKIKEVQNSLFIGKVLLFLGNNKNPY